MSVYVYVCVCVCACVCVRERGRERERKRRGKRESTCDKLTEYVCEVTDLTYIRSFTSHTYSVNLSRVDSLLCTHVKSDIVCVCDSHTHVICVCVTHTYCVCV